MTFGFGMGFPRNNPFSGGPSLNLQLAGNTTLDPRITFSRTSNATLFDSAGNLVYAPHNLLTFSEQFDNSAWVKTGVTVSANTAIAPNGTATADALVEDTLNSGHQLSRSGGAGLDKTTTHTFSIRIKPVNRTRFRLRLNFYTSNVVSGTFNTADGALSTSVAGTGVAVNAVLLPLADGWFEASISGYSTTAGSGFDVDVFILDSTGGAVFTGNGLPAFQLWGAQLNVGALQPYYSTTVKNLLGYSQEFGNAAWTKTRSSISVTKVVAPDGSLTGQSLVEDTTASSTHDLVVSSAFVAGTPATLSIYAKSNGRNLRVFLPTAAFTVSVSVVFDLAAGTTSVATGTPIATIQNVGNGWYRCGLTATPTTTASGSITFRMLDGSTASYTGDGTSGIFIWGAQLSDSASLDPYVYNPVAAPSNVAYYGPRFDYSPTTLQPLGLLIEEQRTNLAWPSADFSGASWTRTNIAPVAGSVTAPDGSVCGAYASTDPSSILKRLRFNLLTTAAGAYTWSIFLRAGTEDSCAFNVQDGTGSNGAVMSVRLTDGVITTGPSVYGTATGPTASVQPAGNGFYRISISANFVSAVTQIQAILTWDLNGVSATTGTLFPWGAQLEAGSFPTSYIPTTTAATTRAADVATMIGDNFSNWYNQSEGTLYVEGDAGLSSLPCFVSIDDTTVSNRIQLRRQSSDTFASFRMVSSSGQIDVSLLSGSATGVNKQIAAFSAGSQSSAANGVLIPGITPLVTMPVVSRLDIGAGVGSNLLNGYIRQIAYYPRRLGNAELQSLTV